MKCGVNCLLCADCGLVQKLQRETLFSLYLSGITSRYIYITIKCTLDLHVFVFSQQSSAMLASAVLAEVPTQLTEYMRKRGIVPHNVQS